MFCEIPAELPLRHRIRLRFNSLRAVVQQVTGTGTARKMDMRTLRILSLIGCLGVLAYAAYAVVFFGWLSATPLSDAQAKRTKYNHDIWLGIAIVAAILAVLLFARGFKNWRSSQQGAVRQQMPTR